jgi:hypothetical protein
MFLETDYMRVNGLDIYETQLYLPVFQEKVNHSYYYYYGLLRNDLAFQPDLIVSTPKHHVSEKCSWKL